MAGKADKTKLVGDQPGNQSSPRVQGRALPVQGILAGEILPALVAFVRPRKRV